MIKQRGSVTVMVIIVLISMLILSVALLRSSESVSHITSSMAFHEAAKQMGDVGIYQALNSLVNNASLDTTVPNEYYATILNTDANGLPQGIDWNNVPSTTMNNNYTVQYVIERMCSGALPITDPDQQCIISPQANNGSQKLGAPLYINFNKYHYRITVLITGPKNTEVYIQAVVTR